MAATFLSGVCGRGDTRVVLHIHCLWKRELLSIMTLGKFSGICPYVGQLDSRSEG